MSKLTTICNITTGKLDSNAATSTGKYPYFTCAPIPLKIDSYSFDDDVILLAGNNAQGNFHLNRYNGKFDAYQRTYIIKPSESNYIEYIKYSLELALKHFKNISQGSQTKFLTMKMLDSFDIKDLTYEEQYNLIQSIVLIDKKIENNNKIISTLEELSKTLYNYWFVQFEFPDDNGKPYKSSGGKMVRNEIFKKDIPDGWKVESMINNSINNVIKPGVDYFANKTYYPTAEIEGTNIGVGTIISYNDRELRANMQPTPNSVWFAKMKSSKKHLFIDSNFNEFINNSVLSTGFMGIQCDDNSFEYVSSFIENDFFEIKKDSLAHGATQEAVNNDDVSKINLLIPTDFVLKKYQLAAGDNFKFRNKLRNENKELSKIRDWLLPMLMNGQANIDD